MVTDGYRRTIFTCVTIKVVCGNRAQSQYKFGDLQDNTVSLGSYHLNSLAAFTVGNSEAAVKEM